jgi:hypothetical protein
MAIPIHQIKEALDYHTHLKVQNDIGVELNSTLRNYETQIRQNGKITNPQQFTSDMKDAINKALANISSLNLPSGGTNAFATAIINLVYRSVFGFEEGDVEKYLENNKLDNYDTFSYNMIQQSSRAAVTLLRNHGRTGVEQYIQNPTLRPEFFRETAAWLPTYGGPPTNPRGFSWTAFAKNNCMDVTSITDIVEAAASRKLNPDDADQRSTILRYNP